MPDSTIEIAAPLEAVMAALARTAEDWGADYKALGPRHARLRLGVVAGLRRGWELGEVVADEKAGDNGETRLTFQSEESELHLHAPSVSFLLLALAGGAVTAIWPFFPKLLPVAPFGALLALSGWFLVLNRLRTAGVEEFLTGVAVAALHHLDPHRPR